MSDPQTLMLAAGETMPNSMLPVLIYRGVIPEAGTAAERLEAMFAANGWGGSWRDGVYEFDHYHSNAHEVLGVASGAAELQLGGDGGEEVQVAAGDVLVLPAGTGHRRISSDAAFTVVGAYPAGQERYDICRERSPEAEMRISHVQVPDADPVGGRDGALTRLWRG